MVTKSKIEIEISADGNAVYFPPVGRALRGAFDAQALRQSAPSLMTRWPEPIPGTRIGLDMGTGEKYIREPLWDEEHTNVRQRVLERGYQLPTRIELSTSDNTATWAHFMRQLVECGLAQVVEGQIPPADAFSDPVRKNFITPPRVDNDIELRDALKKLVRAIELQTKLLASLVNDKK